MQNFNNQLLLFTSESDNRQFMLCRLRIRFGFNPNLKIISGFNPEGNSRKFFRIFSLIRYEAIVKQLIKLVLQDSKQSAVMGICISLPISQNIHTLK